MLLGEIKKNAIGVRSQELLVRKGEGNSLKLLITITIIGHFYYELTQLLFITLGVQLEKR